MTAEPLQEEDVFLLGKDPVEVGGIWLAGLGGAPPGVFEGTQVFPGHPYATSEECDMAISNLLTPQLVHPQYILVTHFPAFSQGEIQTRGVLASAGSQALETLISSRHSEIILFISGHVHRQMNCENFYGTHSVNPGSTLYGNYAMVTLELKELWKVSEVLLKSL